jgi:hypothetical protein
MNPKHNYKAWFMEYPNLLFGKVLGVDVFNATKFLESLNIDTKQIDKFKTDKANVIEEYSKRLDMPVDQFFMQDDNGDVMIYCDLCFAFLYYVNPSAEMKMHDYMFLLHTRGMVMTDISLATMAKEQLSPTILKYMVDDIKKQES